VASRGCGSQLQAREARGPARQALRPGCEELAARIRRKCRRRKRGPRPKIATVERREARLPPLREAGTPPGARPAASLQANRVPLHPGACRRSAHPSIGVATEEANSEYDVGRKEKGKKKKENGEEKKTEKKKWGEARFVGWAARASTPVCDGLWAHAERSATSPRARSRAPCPRGRRYREGGRRGHGAKTRP
jgi:hypothetical protein